jgi:hypothetical protein
VLQESRRAPELSPPCKRSSPIGGEEGRGSPLGVRGGGPGTTGRLVCGSGPLARPAELPRITAGQRCWLCPVHPPNPPFARGGKEALARDKGATKSGLDRGYQHPGQPQLYHQPRVRGVLPAKPAPGSRIRSGSTRGIAADNRRTEVLSPDEKCFTTPAGITAESRLESQALFRRGLVGFLRDRKWAQESKLLMLIFGLIPANAECRSREFAWPSAAESR